MMRKIDAIIEERSLLKHPFYQMWSDGKLDKESLAGYSKEYFQLVKAVPEFMSPIIDRAPIGRIRELAANMGEEQDHIELWQKFAESLGVSESELEDYEGLPKTQEAIVQLRSLMTDYVAGSCAMYALEKEIPKISKTKLDGLKTFYGIDDDDATRYFEQHMEADVRHTASWKSILDASDRDPEKLADAARASMAAQNLLLDACYEEYCTAR